MPRKKKSANNTVNPFDKAINAAESSKRQSTDDVLTKIVDGRLPQECLQDIKANGRNEEGDPLRWGEPGFAEAILLLADLRVPRVFISGSSQRYKTCATAQVNAWLSQRGGLRTAWSFPKLAMMETQVPSQHHPLLENWAKVSGITKFTRSMQRSTKIFNVGRGSCRFTYLNSGSKEAAAGSSVVSYTADVQIVEEASQSTQAEIQPVVRRVDASKIKLEFDTLGPMRQCGTPGGGAGIEARIKTCSHEFWPHAECPHCGKLASLHPKGALLKPVLQRTQHGELFEKWADVAGMPLDWHHDDPNDKFGSAFIACCHCGKELPDDVRQDSHFYCVNTGISLINYLGKVVPERWRDEDLHAGIWVARLSSLSNGRKMATAIMREMSESPEGIDDLWQQLLGIPSSEVSNTITSEKIISAIKRPDWEPKKDKAGNTTDRVVTLMGIDQGRSAWWCSVVQYIYNPYLPPSLAYSYAKRNVLYMEGMQTHDVADVIETYGIDGGLIDNEPSIDTAARTCEETGLHLADQKPKQKDDFKIIEVEDGGIPFDCVGIKDRKYAKSIFAQFDAGQYSINGSYLVQQGNQRSPRSLFRHLTGVQWDSAEGKVEKAKDGVDDLFFSLMFAEAAFGLFLVDEDAVSLGADSWDWYDSW